MEYLIKEAVSLVTDLGEEELLELKPNKLNFTYQPKADEKMSLEGWNVSKMFPKPDGNFVVIYRRSNKGNDYLVPIQQKDRNDRNE